MQRLHHDLIARCINFGQSNHGRRHTRVLTALPRTQPSGCLLFLSAAWASTTSNMAERLYGPGHELNDTTLAKLKLRRNDPDKHSVLVTTNVNNTESIDCVVYNAIVTEE